MSSSEQLFEAAKKVLPGGVNSPVRAFKRVGGTPIFFEKAQGAWLYDTDGKAYIDYIGSWGPMILGHSHPDVINSIQEAINKGLSFGAPTQIETELAETIRDIMPSIEMIRMVNSGTEATMSAIRLARGFTRRDKILKFEGCYHGHCDSLLVKAGSGALTLGEPDSLGVPAAFAENTLTLEYNNLEQVQQVFKEAGESIAAIIVEPVAGNMSCVLPKEGFLAGLRQVCDTYGALLIFDEVMTGFRVARGGAQSIYDVKPDLTTLGKVMGGGMPVGAFGGRREVMELLAPLGGVYQAGTLSGNPVAMTAGLATLKLINSDDFYHDLTQKTETLMSGFETLAEEKGIPLAVNQVGGMFGFFFTSSESVDTFSHVMNSDTERFNRFFHAMLEAGVNLAPSPFESGFVSSAHSEKEIALTLEAVGSSFNQLT